MLEQPLNTYRLVAGARAQAVTAQVVEHRAGLPYPLTHQVPVAFRVGDVVATSHDLSAWVRAGVLESVTPVARPVIVAAPVVAPPVVAPVVVEAPAVIAEVTPEVVVEEPAVIAAEPPPVAPEAPVEAAPKRASANALAALRRGRK